MKAAHFLTDASQREVPYTVLPRGLDAAHYVSSGGGGRDSKQTA